MSKTNFKTHGGPTSVGETYPAKAGHPNKIGAVMVVGAGVGGIQASIDLAESGFKVYLVDKNPGTGGVMAQLDKTFPTNDCAMCTLAPRLVEIGRHKDIKIITMSEVEKISGEVGNFTVSLVKRPRFVIEEKCTGCGSCWNTCPATKIPSKRTIKIGEKLISKTAAQEPDSASSKPDSKKTP